MDGATIRKAYLDFFRDRKHAIVPSAPMVVRNDPTLMFTNAGMNQFKDYFLGHTRPKDVRVSDTQKCLRVSGKHNDLEEVGVDTYHHTMFEMLGNWSFGDYFKPEAIAWAWELLTEVYKIEKDRIYVTVFGGDRNDGLPADDEAAACWKDHVAGDRILPFGKGDNFWEMGDTGPCGPCTEIHVDLRPAGERKKVPAAELVNAGHPQVIEVWNLVFIEFDRKAGGKLENLPARHVDTGMGFERLCMVLQGKTSNYDTDVFRPLIARIEKAAGTVYGKDEKKDIAMRVMADHVRAVAFAVADGQLPSNTGAGYVIRRILRRAVRYAFSFLDLHEPSLYRLVGTLAAQFNEVFPELASQKELIENVIREEESSFLKTLEQGMSKFGTNKEKTINGDFAFELYDTFGFPVDLTQLMAREQGREVDMKGFHAALEKQKNRSRAAGGMDAGDWVDVHDDAPSGFVGYEQLECPARILKYRKVTQKKKTLYQFVLNRTPFYAESGGQVGDTGTLSHEGETIRIVDTIKENDLWIHLGPDLPADPAATFTARVDTGRRARITANHSATHLMHSGLRQVLGTHVTQKGSLVNDRVTRFDFSHFAKVTHEQIREIEAVVNARITEDIALDERREVPVQDALEMGAMALFGEKYGETVRVIAFDPKFSVELCGGTHVPSTGRIGLFKIVSESAVASGIRRVEAVTGAGALEYVNARLDQLHETTAMLGNVQDPVQAVRQLLDENQQLKKEGRQAALQQADAVKQKIKSEVKEVQGIKLYAGRIDLASADAIKHLSFELKKEIPGVVALLAAEVNDKPLLSLVIDEGLVKVKNLDARVIIKELARDIRGGGGGQPFYATAGGKDMAGLDKAVSRLAEVIAAQASVQG